MIIGIDKAISGSIRGGSEDRLAASAKLCCLGVVKGWFRHILRRRSDIGDGSNRPEKQ